MFPLAMVRRCVYNLIKVSFQTQLALIEASDCQDDMRYVDKASCAIL